MILSFQRCILLLGVCGGVAVCGHVNVRALPAEAIRGHNSSWSWMLEVIVSFQM